MRWANILTAALTALGLCLSTAPAAQTPQALPQDAATTPQDDVFLQLRQAYWRGDKARVAALLPQARGHALEPWAAYWALKLRLEDATEEEVQAFLSAWPNTYQEDRLRNDWLLLAGKRREWAAFARHLPHFRMADDPEVRCYALAMDALHGAPVEATAAAQMRRDWLAQKSEADGCLLAAELLLRSGQLKPHDVWLKARLALEHDRASVARSAVALLSLSAPSAVAQIQKQAQAYLDTLDQASLTPEQQQLATLALVRLGRQQPEQAAALLQSGWASHLPAEARHWAWGVTGKWAAVHRLPSAESYFAQVRQWSDLSDDLLGWKVRAHLRNTSWAGVQEAIAAMSAPAQQEAIWVYWRARAGLALATDEAARTAARASLESVATGHGFYEKLALEELGRPLTRTPAPPPLTPAERQAARAHLGLNRALLAIALGLQPEGVREWNYWTRLHTPGGMDERALYAAAELACHYEAWDRCINTSEHTRSFVDFAQRFPLPHEAAVVPQARRIGLDPAYVYGLMRQESRFVMSARSSAGASGLMQIMPATARWTARKIGLEGFHPSQINELDTNVLIGTHYLKLALDEFNGSLPLAAAAYNAGPGRPRSWRNGPELEGAIWAETVPFGETRDYIKQVLSNTVDYALLLTDQPQSLKARLGRIGPAPAGEPPHTPDLP